MQLIDVDPRQLTPAPYNPRTMAAHEGENLVRSLRDWGVIENIVVNRRTGHIVSGHMRVAAAVKAGLATVPVHYLDVDETTERQINLHMNRTRGQWDDQGLAEVLAWLQAQDADMALTGFGEDEIAKILDGVCDVGLDEPGDAGLDVVPEQFGVVVACRDDAAQRELLERLIAEGYTCRALLT